MRGSSLESQDRKVNTLEIILLGVPPKVALDENCCLLLFLLLVGATAGHSLSPTGQERIYKWLWLGPKMILTSLDWSHDESFSLQLSRHPLISRRVFGAWRQILKGIRE